MKGKVLLRMCNELIRRLSRTEDTVYCGRIMMFLANVYPISDRSGQNMNFIRTVSVVSGLFHFVGFTY